MKRFWEKVEKTEGCWFWIASIGPEGYGRFWNDGRCREAHRIAFELTVGPIPHGLVIDHLCRVRHCVNPAHMEAVPERVNIMRGLGASALNAVKTHCKNGHCFTPENTYLYTVDGGQRRSCRACNRECQARRMAIRAAS